MAVRWLNEAKEHNYIFLINNGEGARSRGTQAGEYFNVKTSAPNLNSAIYNIFKALTGDTVEDYFEDDIPEDLLDAVDDWDISGGWPWIEGIKEDGKVLREPQIEVIYHEDEGWYEEANYADYVEPDVIEEWDIDVTEEEYSDEEYDEEETSKTDSTETFVINNGVLKKYNGSEQSVVIPDSVTEIGDFAFEGCTSLTHIKIPSRVTEIGGRAFCVCTSLTRIEIPNSRTGIGWRAFDGCPNLTVYCPEGSYAERYCIKNDIDYEII